MGIYVKSKYALYYETWLRPPSSLPNPPAAKRDAILDSAGGASPGDKNDDEDDDDDEDEDQRE